MQQRYFDPIAGRFLSVDPVVTDTQTGDDFNRYVYANGNPYKYVDPDGNTPAHAIAFAVGFGVDLIAQGLSGKSASQIFSREGLTSAGIAGVGAAATGGIGGLFAKAALRETISVGGAVAGTAAAGGGVGAVTTVATELATKGQMPTLSQVAVGVGSSTLGAGAGAGIANTGVALTQKMAAAGGVMGHVAAQTRSAVQSTQAVTVGVGTGRAVATAATDVSSATVGKAAENQLPQR